MKIYISGKISDLELEEARNNFQMAEEKLINKFSNYFEEIEIINPMKLVKYEPNKTWGEYMIECICLLEDCQMIYMLDNWKDSVGARIELAYATRNEIDVIMGNLGNYNEKTGKQLYLEYLKKMKYKCIKKEDYEGAGMFNEEIKRINEQIDKNHK